MQCRFPGTWDSNLACEDRQWECSFLTDFCNLIRRDQLWVQPGLLAGKWLCTELAGSGEGALKQRFRGPGRAKAKSLTCSQREVSRAREVVVVALMELALDRS